MFAVLKSIARPRRARPAAGLDDWAQRRGLSPRGNRPLAGHLSVTGPWSEDLLFSVARGRFPLGADGVVCHEARLYPAEVDGDLRVAIADGVLTAWRLRRGWQPEGPALDRLAADVAAIVRRRGL
jgi:hypothetical protein